MMAAPPLLADFGRIRMACQQTSPERGVNRSRGNEVGAWDLRAAQILPRKRPSCALFPQIHQHEANRIPRQSASIAANSIRNARADGTPSLSLRSTVPAYSSRIAAYCPASRESRANSSSTMRASRALSVPVACQGNSISISPDACLRRLLLIAIVGSLVPSRLPTAVRPVSCVHRTNASSPRYPPHHRLLPACKCLGAEHETTIHSASTLARSCT